HGVLRLPDLHSFPTRRSSDLRWVALVGTVMLLIAFVPVLIQIWPSLIATVGNGTIIVLALFTLVGVAVGHFVGGPDPDNRTVLRSEEHTSELQSRFDLVCRLL